MEISQRKYSVNLFTMFLPTSLVALIFSGKTSNFQVSSRLNFKLIRINSYPC